MTGTVGSLDSMAYSAVPLGMDAFVGKGQGLIRWKGFWRLVVGSPAWGWFYGLPSVPGWDNPAEWNTPETWPTAGKTGEPSATPPMPSVPTLDLVLVDDMPNTTQTDFQVVPGGVTTDATTGSFASTGAAVSMTTSAQGQTKASVSSPPMGWSSWLPWLLLAAAVGLALKSS